MAEMWTVTPTTGSPLLDPRPRRDIYVVDDYGAWNMCPIDNSINNACFHLPGVTDGTTPS